MLTFWLNVYKKYIFFPKSSPSQNSDIFVGAKKCDTIWSVTITSDYSKLYSSLEFLKNIPSLYKNASVKMQLPYQK